MFYSPIGDGVVAADGVELKRIPPEMSPRVEVIKQRIVERGDPGKAGVRVTEKKWTTGGGTLLPTLFVRITRLILFV